MEGRREGGDERADASDVLPDQTCFFTFMETLLKKHPIPLSVVAKTRVNEEVNIRSVFVPDQVFVYRFSANKFDKMSLALLRGFGGDLFWPKTLQYATSQRIFLLILLSPKKGVFFQMLINT